MNNKKKITVLFIRQKSGEGGGVDTVLYELLSALPESTEIEPIVAYLHKAHIPITPLIERLQKCNIPCFDLGGRFLSLKQYIALYNLIKTYKVDVLHSNDEKSTLYSFLLRLQFPHLTIFKMIHGWTKRNWKTHLYDEVVDKNIGRFFHEVICVSGMLADEIRTFGVKNPVVLHNGIDIQKWQPPLTLTERDTLTVGFIGRMSIEKNPIAFVQVAERVLAQTDKCCFVMAGAGLESEKVEKAIANSPYSASIKYLGHVTYQEIIQLYTQIDLLLSVSLTEGLPLALLEAGAMSLPVVATRVGGVPEVIEHGVNGFLAELHDIETLANYVIQLANNRTLAKEMGQANRHIIERKFSLQKQWQTLEDLYLKYRKSDNSQ
jgi:glycosyltransferase involved in cell wall biosynthesis